jgi:molybdate transport system ATP-binding protein
MTGRFPIRETWVATDPVDAPDRRGYIQSDTTPAAQPLGLTAIRRRRAEMQRRAILASLLALGAAGAEAQSPVTVFAAASLTDALRALGQDWAARGNPPPRLSFAASSALARQIEQGAPADLFMSADEPWMDYVQQRNLLVPGTRVSPLGNALVLVGPADRARPVALARGTDLGALLGPNGRIATGDPAHVPAGRYAQAALDWMGQWGALAPRLARADSVRAALLLVERGEAPLGIVYATDAAASPGVRVVGTFPAESHPPVTYPFALLRRAEGNAQARALLAFLAGPEAQPACSASASRSRGERRGVNLGPEEWQAVRLSLEVASRSVLVSLVPAVAVAWVLARGRFPGRLLLDALVHLPLVVPPVVVGWALLMLFGVRGPVGAPLNDWFGIRLVFSTDGAALATAVMSFPLIVRAVRLGLDGVDPGPGGGGRHTRRRAHRPVRDGDAALDVAGDPRRRGHRLRGGARRVRRGDHLRLEHPRRDADPAAGDLQRHADPGRRGDGGAARAGLLHAGHGRAAAGGADRAAHASLARPRLMPEVALRHRFGAQGFALDVAFAAPRHGVTALFGPSGCGKSTILAAIAGLLHPREGRVALDGDVLLDTAHGICLPPERRRCAVVFQDARLFPHLSVATNLRYGLRRAPRGADGPSLEEMVALLGIGHLLARRPAGLSGGERQRVALGRALLARPRLLLMDEPLAALDAARRAEVLPFLARLRDVARLPILYVTHALDEVDALADELVLLDGGRVSAAGPVEMLAARTDLPLAARRDAGVLIACTVLEAEAGGLARLGFAGGELLTTLRPGPPGTRLRVRLRARDVAVALEAPRGLSTRNILLATLAEIRPAGEPAEVFLRLEVGPTPLLARVTRESVDRLALRPGMAVWALVKAVTFDQRVAGEPRG